MQYTHLGRSGLSVSRLCLGTMNFGTKTEEAAHDEGRERSRQPCEAKSRLPYYLGLAVASVAAYLKSLFHEPARAEPESEGAGGEPPCPAPAPPRCSPARRSQ